MLISFFSSGCAGSTRDSASEDEAGEQAAAETGTVAGPRFVDVTQAAGISFVHHNGATERRYLPETMGAGVAFFDYDGDGDADLYFVDGETADGSASGALYQNRGDGTFRDVTAEAGLTASFYGMGAAVGDVDGDGLLDLFVSAVGGDRLFLNLGPDAAGVTRFADATRRFGLGQPAGFSASAAFFDADLDGDLDLYVTRYVTWSRATDVRCTPDRVRPSYCTPEVYQGAANRFYRNLDGRRFEDATRQAGLWQPGGKSLGVVASDLDGDGLPDLAVANDTSPNALYHNLGAGRFQEIGVAAGFAFSESGATRGGMGIDAGDVDGDGLPDLAVGNFAQEMTALYRAVGPDLYIDDAAQRGIGLPTLLPLAFGTLLVDLDADGDLDLVLANGHIEPQISLIRPLHQYAQRPQLFTNLGPTEPGRFAELEPAAGDAFAAPLVGRGLATADVDGDGDLDLAVTQNGGPARLFENQADPAHWLRLRLRGTTSNRFGYGARVRLVAGERSWERELTSGRSYLSASEPVLTFGLGEAAAVERLEIRWPSGREQVIEDPPLNRLLTVEEPPP